MSQTSRFQLQGIYSFSKQKTEVEGLQAKVAGIEKVELGNDKVVKFVHNPSLAVAQIRKALEDMKLRPSDDRNTKN